MFVERRVAVVHHRRLGTFTYSGFETADERLWLSELENKNVAVERMKKLLPDKPPIRIRAALIICNSLMSCLELFEGQPFSSLKFAEELEKQNIVGAELKSCRKISGLLNELDILMSKFLLDPAWVRTTSAVFSIRTVDPSVCTPSITYLFFSQIAQLQASSAKAVPHQFIIRLMQPNRRIKLFCS